MTRRIILSITVATLGKEGIARLAGNILPPLEGVEWIVSWQESGATPVPESLIREDVEIFRFSGSGLSANRNNAVAKANGEIVLISDDDVEYSPEGIETVISVFSSRPEIDVACFKAEFPFRKTYPPASRRLGIPLPKGYSVASVEMASRTEVARRIPFHPLLGLGAPEFQGGEDEFFLLQCIRSGCECVFIDKTICRHSSMPTGTSPLSRGNLRASGCLIAKTYPLSFPLRIPLKAFRLSRGKRRRFFPMLLQLAIGALHSRKIE